MKGVGSTSNAICRVNLGAIGCGMRRACDGGPHKYVIRVNRLTFRGGLRFSGGTSSTAAALAYKGDTSGVASVGMLDVCCDGDVNAEVTAANVTRATCRIFIFAALLESMVHRSSAWLDISRAGAPPCHPRLPIAPRRPPPNKQCWESFLLPCFNFGVFERPILCARRKMPMMLRLHSATYC